MNAEEDDAIDKLLHPKASAAQQKSALKWFAEYLEESYILNIRASKTATQALETFSTQSQANATLKTRAKNLIKKYGR